MSKKSSGPEEDSSEEDSSEEESDEEEPSKTPKKNVKLPFELYDGN